MKHHFADLLDREGSYWTIIPNRNRYSFSTTGEIADKKAVKILTINKDDVYWKQIFDCPNIEELTLHAPSKEQVREIQKLPNIKRLRITFFRTRDLDFLRNLTKLEELVVEYVSGFSDLSPLQDLKKLRSLHLENLRGVTNFDGLKGIDTLRYLHIDGTLDWNQPIQDFTFLDGLLGLEVFSLGFIGSKTGFPAFAPIINLKSLRKVKIGRASFNTKEYAFLQAALPNVDGCSWDLCWEYSDNYEFLGKGAGRVKKNNPGAVGKCEEFIRKYELMKRESEDIIITLR